MQESIYLKALLIFFALIPATKDLKFNGIRINNATGIVKIQTEGINAKDSAITWTIAFEDINS